MLKPTIAVLAVCAIGLWGCGSKTAAAPDNPSPKVATQPPADTKPSDPNAIPENLKHEAFQYSGLGNTKAMKMKLVSSSSGAPTQEGEVINSLDRIEKGVAYFKTKRTEGLASLMGEDELAVRPDGIYLVKTSSGTLEKESLQLPAKLEAGKSWSEKQNITATTGQKITVDGANSVGKAEKIKVAGETYDAIPVISSGKMTLDGRKSEVTIKSWYVKDLGVVKHEIKETTGGGQPVTLTLEMTK